MRLVLFVVLALLLLPEGFGAWREVVPESEEISSSFDGERTCLADASEGGSPSCPLELSGFSNPSEGVRVLDSRYVAYLFPRLDVGSVVGSDPSRGPNEYALRSLVFSNPSDSTVLPPLLLPGAGSFVAYFGYWNNLDEDSSIRIDFDNDPKGPLVLGGFVPTPQNEWAPIPSMGGKPLLLGYVEPGPHPTPRSTVSPDSFSPDFRYEYINRYPYWVTEQGSLGAPGPIVFLDGSLFEDYTVTTVNDASLAPTCDSETCIPYTPSPTSLVDIDRYVHLAPAPIDALYAPLAPLVHSIGSPSLGLCPNNCQLDRIPATGTPLDNLSGPLAMAVFSPYEPEWREGSGNTASGRLSEFQTSYHAWVDALPRYDQPLAGFGSVNEPHGTPLLRNSRGEPSVPPGYFRLDVFVGIWYDRSGDGRVGVLSNPSDPYDEGRRPLPDDYVHSAGEFIGTKPTDPTTGARRGNFTVWLVPKTDWGPLGVYRSLGPAPYPIAGWESQQGYACVPPTRLPGVNYGGTCVGPYLTGPIAVDVRSESTGLEGWYVNPSAVIFPMGSPEFDLCTVPLLVDYVSAGISVSETVQDCDSIGAWDSLPGV